MGDFKMRSLQIIQVVFKTLMMKAELRDVWP